MILTEQLIKSKSLTVNLVIALSGSLLLSLLARLSIPVPFSPVPITGQTFGILFLGAVLGSRIGTLSVIMYISEGLMGLPVFAGGTMGFLYLLGPTGGYLIGFIPAVYLVGYFSERNWTIKFTTTLITMLLGTSVIFFFGISWLTVTAGLKMALSVGLYPYLTGAGIKVILATVIVYSLNHVNK
jgi:biotin transport system substrate-specific component